MSFLAWLENAALLLLVVLAIPIVIVLFGAPLALLIRIVVEIAERFYP